MEERDEAEPGVVRVAVAGAGERGGGYARWIREHPDRARLVAVAEPRAKRRGDIAAEHRLPTEAVVAHWRDLDTSNLDAVVIATQDRDHAEAAVSFLDRGLHVLLEKPIAPTLPECARVVEAARQRPDRVFAVCHVLQYTPHTLALRALLAEDAIGEIVSVQHLEPVGWWHQAHSFVRGNWGNESRATFMLLAKSCHDIDWLLHIVGRPARRVSSFGSLTHFTAAHRPEGAAERCLDCRLERTCAYSATRIYLDRALAGDTGWPVSVLAEDPTPERIRDALESGPYGRCVYACDNDVVDHQVVAMEFDGGATATFTMTAFTEMAHRRTEIFGTQGCLRSDGRMIDVLDFRTGQWTSHDTHTGADSTTEGGHGGGDAGLMDSFIGAVAAGDPGLVSSGAEASYASHAATFAAESARRHGVVETLAAPSGG
ncbi:MAG: Gfo/Idh/MocA family protein [Arachnia sp.]